MTPAFPAPLFHASHGPASAYAPLQRDGEKEAGVNGDEDKEAHSPSLTRSFIHSPTPSLLLRHPPRAEQMITTRNNSDNNNSGAEEGGRGCA